jgi:hypothetical protein
MHKLYELKEKLMRELEDYSENGKFSKEDVEAIKYITSAIDHICNIMEDADGDEYSERMMPYAYEQDGGNRGGGYSRNYAYARGRRRDSMGRYSREGSKEEMVAQLRDMMHNAPDERTRMRIEELVREFER